MSARKGIVLLLSGLAAGCVADRPLPVTDDRSAPLALVRPMHCGNRVQYCQSQSPDGRLPMSTINDTLLRFIDGKNTTGRPGMTKQSKHAGPAAVAEDSVPEWTWKYVRAALREPEPGINS